MKSMTLTANSYADLEPFETLAKRLGIEVELETKELTPETRIKKRLDGLRELAAVSQRAAKEAGATPDDVTLAIKEVRAKQRLEKYEQLTNKLRGIAKESGLAPDDIPTIIKEVRRENRAKCVL